MIARKTLLAATTGLGATALFAVTAIAQQTAPPPSPPSANAPATPPPAGSAPAPGPQAGGPPAPAAAPAPRGGLTPADRAAFFDARLAAIHAGLQLSPDQDKMWPAVESAVRNGLKSVMESRRDAQQDGAPKDRFEAMLRRGESLAARGAAMQAFAKAAQPLYASFTDDQKRRLPYLMRGGRMGDGHGHDGS